MKLDDPLTDGIIAYARLDQNQIAFGRALHDFIAPALIPQPEADDGSATTEWVPCDQAARRRLAFDHNTILSTAIERLRSKVEYTSLPAFLLPEPFTLPQLQRVYEVVLGRPLDKSAFRKRMLDAAYLEEAGMVTGDHGRPAMGYRLRERDQATVFPRTFKSGE